ncbi:MAG: hypothetical protein CFH15_01057 [Alphaproteobacteria bacterium MarineAlpha5_Bin5]|nr:MAG: hypothetical protein CFH15_01057 [Alphaproteobacteria bacterium MarineAlpha5_Bin5]PPR52336.1 MAG: hypothetical protein CFH14_00401 [Alphaproteobacteria bacterium MarineAlpha5_Bin4]|tara:strand:+ start:2325 stop:3089 length:765 start_codon:yes stop_codon:yes gene_type:complete
MKKIIFLTLILLLTYRGGLSRDIGETEILTDEGIEVFQNEKFYLLKKNVRIVSDNFTLTGNEVKIFFNKDLYDIVDIFAKGNVNLNSPAYNIKSSGKQIYINIVTEEIKVEGKESKLYLENVEMFSDGQIIVNNLSGAFQIIGINSILNSEDIYITGENIDGIFSTNDQKEIVQLNVNDNQISNIKTDDLDMYSKKAIYNKKTSIIELFENVKIIRGSEIITGDYGTFDTIKNSYKVKSNNTNKVKVVITNTDE